MRLDTKADTEWAIVIIHHFDGQDPAAGYHKEYQHDACGNRMQPGILHYESPEIEDIKLVCNFPVEDEGESFSDRFELIHGLSALLISECSRTKFNFVPNFRYVEDFGAELDNAPHKTLIINGEFSPKK